MEKVKTTTCLVETLLHLSVKNDLKSERDRSLVFISTYNIRCTYGYGWMGCCWRQFNLTSVFFIFILCKC